MFRQRWCTKYCNLTGSLGYCTVGKKQKFRVFGGIRPPRSGPSFHTLTPVVSPSKFKGIISSAEESTMHGGSIMTMRCSGSFRGGREKGGPVRHSVAMPATAHPLEVGVCVVGTEAVRVETSPLQYPTTCTVLYSTVPVNIFKPQCRTSSRCSCCGVRASMTIQQLR